MVIDKKIVFIAIEAVIIIILIILMLKKPFSSVDDTYLQQLKQQNLELANQMSRLKQNYIDIGLADSIQTKNMDSLITISNRKVNGLRDEAKTYRDALEGMQKQEWTKLTKIQKDAEIKRALDFLQNDEKQK